MSESPWEGAIAMGRHLLMCRIMVQTLLEHRDDPQPKCQRLPLVQDQHTVSMAGRNLYDTVRDCWRGQNQWWKGPCEPQVPLDEGMSQQLPAHVREPLHLHLFLLFCFLSPRIFSPPGLSGPVNFVSNAVQHCWSHHAPAWELLLPAW